jgi:hypothetical protein
MTRMTAATAMRPTPAAAPSPASPPAAPPPSDESLCQKRNAPKRPSGIAAASARKERHPMALSSRDGCGFGSVIGGNVGVFASVVQARRSSLSGNVATRPSSTTPCPCGRSPHHVVHWVAAPDRGTVKTHSLRVRAVGCTGSNEHPSPVQIRAAPRPEPPGHPLARGFAFVRLGYARAVFSPCSEHHLRPRGMPRSRPASSSAANPTPRSRAAGASRG